MNASDFNFREDAPKEHADACSSVEQFYRKSLHQSLVGTFLCVMHLDGQSTIVDIFVDGILPIQRFSIEQALTECLQRNFIYLFIFFFEIFIEMVPVTAWLALMISVK